MGQITITRRIEKGARAVARAVSGSALTRREQLLVLEIGMDRIDSASSFVGYISEAYGFSKSSVWYNLNRLKEKGVVDFATKDEPGKALLLTKEGACELHIMERRGVRLEDYDMQLAAPAAPAAASSRDILAERMPNPPITIVNQFSRM